MHHPIDREMQQSVSLFTSARSVSTELGESLSTMNQCIRNMRTKCESSVGYEKRNVDARFLFSLSRHDQFNRHSPVPRKAHLSLSLSSFAFRNASPQKRPNLKDRITSFSFVPFLFSVDRSNVENEELSELSAGDFDRAKCVKCLFDESSFDIPSRTSSSHVDVYRRRG